MMDEIMLKGFADELSKMSADAKVDQDAPSTGRRVGRIGLGILAGLAGGALFGKGLSALHNRLYRARVIGKADLARRGVASGSPAAKWLKETWSGLKHGSSERAMLEGFADELSKLGEDAEVLDGSEKSAAVREIGLDLIGLMISRAGMEKGAAEDLVDVLADAFNDESRKIAETSGKPGFWGVRPETRKAVDKLSDSALLAMTFDDKERLKGLSKGDMEALKRVALLRSEEDPISKLKAIAGGGTLGGALGAGAGAVAAKYMKSLPLRKVVGSTVGGALGGAALGLLLRQGQKDSISFAKELLESE